MTRKQSCHILERFAHQIAEIPADELQKKWQNTSMRKEKNANETYESG